MYGEVYKLLGSSGGDLRSPEIPERSFVVAGIPVLAGVGVRRAGHGYCY